MDKLTEIIGPPYFESHNCLIFCTDSLVGMSKIKHEIFDLTVTSPPYNIGKEYESLQPVNEYLGWCESWIAEVHRLTKATGAFWLNLGYLQLPERAKALPIPYLIWDRIQFFLLQEIVWNYGAGVASKKFFSPRNEKLLWYVKNQEQYTFNLDDIRDKNVKYPHQKKNGKLKCNPLGKNPTDVWQIAKVTSGEHRSSKERTPHPAQFPIALIDRVIKASSNLNDLVFDPFLGSGTTAIVALANGRRFVGFEIQEKYCALSKQRIKKFFESPRQMTLA